MSKDGRSGFHSRQILSTSIHASNDAVPWINNCSLHYSHFHHPWWSWQRAACSDNQNSSSPKVISRIRTDYKVNFFLALASSFTLSIKSFYRSDKPQVRTSMLAMARCHVLINIFVHFPCILKSPVNSQLRCN